MSLKNLNKIPVRVFINRFAKEPLAITSRHAHQNRRYDDSVFGNTSSLIRNMENEFNNLKNSIFKSAPYQIQSFFGYPTERPSKYEDLISVDEEGNRKFQLQIPLKGFQPEEICIETRGNLLTVSARKEKEVNIIF